MEKRQLILALGPDPGSGSLQVGSSPEMNLWLFENPLRDRANETDISLIHNSEHVNSDTNHSITKAFGQKY